MRRLTRWIACAICVAPVHAGEVYKWTDAAGRVHYGDSVPADKKATAETLDTSNARVSDTQRREAEARLAKDRAGLPKKEPILSERAPAPAASAPTAQPQPQRPSRSSCEEAWKRYNESYACFDPYRMKGGRVRPEAYQHCVEVLRPDPCD